MNGEQAIGNCFVINLPGRHHKWQRISQELSEWHPTRIDGVLVIENLDAVKIHRGRLGCSLAHIRVLERIVNLPTNGKEIWHLICEDDATTHYSLAEVANVIAHLPPNACGINLGGNQHPGLIFFTVYFPNRERSTIA